MVVKPSTNRKCRKSTEIRMWPCVRGAFGPPRVSPPESAPTFPPSTRYLGSRELGNLPVAAGPAGTVEGPALRRPHSSRAFAPGPARPSLPLPAQWPHQGAKNSTSMRPAEPVSEMRLSKLSSVSSSTSEAATRRATARSSVTPGEQCCAAEAHGDEVRWGGQHGRGSVGTVGVAPATTHPLPALSLLA